MAALLLSLAQPVKTTSRGSMPPRQSATHLRAAPSAWAVLRAGSYMELGLK